MQPCPQHIAEPLLEILRLGLLAIRAAGFSNRGDLCAKHADHLHNIPSLIEDLSPDRLLYYWEAERTTFIEKTNPDDRRLFDDPWSRLKPAILQIKTSSPKPQEVAGAI